ncbi:MAG: hypothetical protein R2795_18150 [Saprospiraceae bacterium]
MRKHMLTIALFVAILSNAQAQLWLEMGPKASFGASGYFNSVIANDSQHDYNLGAAFNYGGVVGLNIGDYHGFNFELLTGTYYQDIIYRPDPSLSLRNSLEWEVLDIYALYRFYPESGMYLELGPKFTRINEISQTSGILPVPVAGQYEEDYISGVLGIGAFLAGSEVMVFKAGLRFEYGLTDMVTAEGMANGYPSIDSALTEQGSTTPYRVSFGLEMSFGVGGIAQGACGRRGFVLGGRYR